MTYGVHAKADGRVDLPATVEGVTFLYGDAPRAALNVDPRFAVFLVRFAKFLHDSWDVTKIYHMGIWPAGFGQYSHDAGLAIDFAGVQTASGERFDPSQLTAAHRTLPFGSKVRVTNIANGDSVIVRINDRGPFSRGRVIDVSHAAAREIGMHRSDTARVKLALLDDD